MQTLIVSDPYRVCMAANQASLLAACAILDMQNYS